MDLKRIRKHDQNNDRSTADSARNRGNVLRDDVANDIVAERKVAGDGDKHVDASRSANGSSDNSGGASRAVVFDLILNGKHL